MKRTTQKNSMLVGALLGVMVAGQAMAADLRYRFSGDWTVITDGPGAGWGLNPNNDGVTPGTSLPGSADTARVNWESNTVTVTTTVPDIRRLQVGVDEKGHLVIANGGTLTAVAGSNGDVFIGNGNNPAGTGNMTVESGGILNVGRILYHGNNADGTSEISGTVNVGSHLWTGWGASRIGTININTGGVLNVTGMIGLNWQNNGAVGNVNVKDGGVLNLAQIHPTDSIRGTSKLDVSGSGLVVITTNQATVISNYVTAGKITSYGGLGTVGIDYNNTNVNQTTIFAIAPLAPPPTNVVWNPAANPSGTGKWNESTNWTPNGVPFSVAKVNFNVVGAIPCTVTNSAAVADYVVMGAGGPGGTLIITNGGILSCGAVSASVIGYDSNALMVVESGGAVSFGFQLFVGLNPDSDGTLIMNGGTVSVAGMFGLGWAGGKGTAQIKGGRLNLSQWDFFDSIKGASVLDVSGSGIVVINDDQQASVAGFIGGGQITANGGAGTVVVDYNNLNAGKTTIYALGAYIAPTVTRWDPSLNFPDVEGLWNNSTNWTGGFGPTNVTEVRLNVADAIPCTVTSAAFAKVVRIGNSGPGGIMIITNGGSLVCSSTEDWNSIGMNNTGLVVVANGGSASYGNHLWIGFSVGAEGTLIMNGGTVTVGQMFGLGWDGGKGTALINGGTLNLSQWHPTDSIKTATSLLNVGGTGKVVITGNYLTSVSNYIAAGKITANGGPNVYYAYYPSTGKTVLSAVVLPPPPQSITAVSVSGGDVTITYQTTAQNTYHIESSPSLSPPVWTPVVGSTNTATGAPVTFTFPVGGAQVFYRTVSVTP